MLSSFWFWIHRLNNLGVDSMKEGEKMELFTKIREFKDFDPADDVYGERDFGAVSVDGTKFFWKIDYYDNQLELDSPDPTNMEVTCRVLTIMRADEY